MAMTPELLNDFHTCCRTIMQNRSAKALNYCVNYAIHGTTIHDEHAAHVQALYILNNMTHWRGADAKSVRATLKAFVKDTK